MPRWARVFVLLVGMVTWVAIVIGSLLLRQVPSAVVVGFPAGLWLALTGRSTIARKRAQAKKLAAAIATVGARPDDDDEESDTR